jgi:hypothetical protein
MATYRFKSVIDEAHTLNVPPDIPRGVVEVTVVSHDEASSDSAVQVEFLEELLMRPARNRSNEDIDAQLNYLRER